MRRKEPKVERPALYLDVAMSEDVGATFYFDTPLERDEAHDKLKAAMVSGEVITLDDSTLRGSLIAAIHERNHHRHLYL